jgi:hypothetical protein
MAVAVQSRGNAAVVWAVKVLAAGRFVDIGVDRRMRGGA